MAKGKSNMNESPNPISNPNPNPNPNPISNSNPILNPNIPSTTIINQSAGNPSTNIGGVFNYIHDHVMYLNNNKFFAGVIMILLNVASKFVPVQFSKSTEEYLKLSVTKQIMVFSMAWMGTRDIYVALVLTAVFTILSDHLFNEESHMCVVPHHKRLLHKMLAKNKDDNITDEEIKEAKKVLAKADQQQKNKEKQEAINKFNFIL